MINFKLTELENNAEEAKITVILKEKGEEIKKDEPLLEVETEKTTMEIKADVTGIIKSIEVEAGDKVKIGDTLAKIDEEVIEDESTEQEESEEEFDIFAPPKKAEAKKLQSKVTVIGGGPGGYVAAIQAAKMGAEVVVVEKEKLGGTCLNWGCIPTKALVRSGEVYNIIKNAEEYGCETDNVKLDMNKVMSRKNNIVNRLVSGIEYLMKEHKITVVYGTGDIKDSNTVIVESDNGKTVIDSENIIIATGSETSYLPIDGIDLPGVIDSNDALELTELPEKMIIVGGGIIGLEFAFVYNNFGVNVTVAEYLGECVTNCGKDIAEEIKNIAIDKGISIETGARVEEIAESENGQYIVKFTHDGEEKYITGDKVLMAVGRKPSYGGIDIEELGLKLDENNRGIKVSKKMQTNVPGIYAIGDVTDIIQLAHVASHQGVVAVKNIMGEDCEMDYSAVPSAVFTDPEIAIAGMLEEEAKEQDIEIEVGKFPFNANGKVLTSGGEEGFIKIIKEKETGRIIGSSIIGTHATDLIAELTLAVNENLTADKIVETIHAHPTTAEVIHEAALEVEGGALHFVNKDK